MAFTTSMMNSGRYTHTVMQKMISLAMYVVQPDHFSMWRWSCLICSFMASPVYYRTHGASFVTENDVHQADFT